MTTTDSELNAMLYPNPVIDNFTIELTIPSRINELSAHIHDAQGKLVWKNAILDTQVDAGISKYGIDVIDLASGVYTVKIRLDNRTIVKKLIVTGK